MKKIIGIILTLILGASIFAFAGCSPEGNTTKEELYVYTNAAFPPFEYKVGKKIMGVDMDIAKLVADELGKELVIKDGEFDNVINNVTQKDNCIGAAGLSITAERIKKVDFSDTYCKIYLYIIYKDSETMPVDGNGLVVLDDMKDKTYGVQSGTTSDSTMSDLTKDTTNKVKKYADSKVALQDMSGKTVDYVVVDEYTAKILVKKIPGYKCAKIAGIDPEEYAIAVKKGNKEVLIAVNKVIAKLKAENKLEELITNHTVK